MRVGLGVVVVFCVFVVGRGSVGDGVEWGCGGCWVCMKSFVGMVVVLR